MIKSRGMPALAGTLILALAAVNCRPTHPKLTGSGGSNGSGSGGASSGTGGDASGSGGSGSGGSGSGGNNGNGSGGSASGGDGSGSGGTTGAGSGGSSGSGSGGDGAGSGGMTGSGSGGTTSSSSGGMTGSGTGGDASGTGGDTSGSGGGTVASCTFPSSTVTSCSPGLDPALNTSGATTESLLSDFSPASWQGSAGKFGVCPAETHIGGAIQAYNGSKTSDGGVATSMSKSVDMEAFVLTGSIAAGDYAGGILAFAQCLNSTKYKGVKFKVGGTVAGCALSVQVQTLSQQSDEYGGKCDHTANTCFNFPKKAVTFDAAAPITVLFADLASTGMPAAVADFTKEIIGIQWQLQASTADCLDIAMTLDDVSLVTQ